MLKSKPRPAPATIRTVAPRVFTAKRPNHVWHLDLGTVPIGFAFWIPWLPLSLPQRWPFCWWIAVVVDHCSRRVMGLAVFLKEPTAADVTRFLGRICEAAGARPAHIITDHGTQLMATAFATWCRRQGIQQRFGAIGKYGSLAVVERCIRSLKNECTRAILVSVRRVEFERELAAYTSWLNADRPHSFLGGATPDEIYLGKMPANRKPRFEPRGDAATIPVRGTAGARSRAAGCRARALRRSSRRAQALAHRDPSPRRLTTPSAPSCPWTIGADVCSVTLASRVRAPRRPRR
jgi:transposase InsO family protein